MIHIGKKIEEVFKSSGMTKKSFAEKINKGRENIYDIFKRDSIDTILLQSISDALNHNFFQYFLEHSYFKPNGVDEPIAEYVKKKKTRILVELELDVDDMIRLGLKDKLIQALNIK